MWAQIFLSLLAMMLVSACVDKAGDKSCKAYGNQGGPGSVTTNQTTVITEALAVGACPGTGGPAMIALRLGYCIDSTEVTQGQYQDWLNTKPFHCGVRGLYFKRRVWPQWLSLWEHV